MVQFRRFKRRQRIRFRMHEEAEGSHGSRNFTTVLSWLLENSVSSFYTDMHSPRQNLDWMSPVLSESRKRRDLEQGSSRDTWTLFLGEPAPG